MLRSLFVVGDFWPPRILLTVENKSSGRQEQSSGGDPSWIEDVRLLIAGLLSISSIIAEKSPIFSLPKELFPKFKILKRSKETGQG